MKRKTLAVLAAAITIITLFPETIHAEIYKSERGTHRAYISGYTDGTIRPEKYLTREEAAAVFYNLLDREETKIRTTFKDVGYDRWSWEAIAALASEGIVSGDEGMFRPEDNITRAEMAVMISKFAKLDGGTKTFSDIEGHWAQKYIEAAVSEGWMAGYTDGEFKPNNYVTRAEAVFFINNALHRNPENMDDMLNDMKVWTDNTDTDKWYYAAIQEASNTHEYVRKENGSEMWNLVID